LLDFADDVLRVLPESKQTIDVRVFEASSVRADVNIDGRVDYEDVMALVELFASVTDIADVNGDGIMDSRDVSAVFSEMSQR
jgi:hypothetical protein